MVHEILPNTDLEYKDIRDTLNAKGGTVTNVVETAFKPENVRMWSWRKPITNDSIILDEDVWNSRLFGSGFTLKPHTTVSPFETQQYDYKLEPPYRISDFRGYNSNADASIKPTDIHFVGAPNGVNGYLGHDDTSARIWFDVILPDIDPHICPVSTSFPEDENKIQIAIYDTNSYQKKVLKEWDFNTLDWNNYRNKNLFQFEMSQSFRLPDAGQVATNTYYLTINGVDVSWTEGKIYKQFMQSPNDDSQWFLAEITNLSPDLIKYNNILYIMAYSETESNGIKFDNLYYLGQHTNLHTVIVEAYTGTNWEIIMQIPGSVFTKDGQLADIVFNGCENWGLGLSKGEKIITLPDGSKPKVVTINGTLKITNELVKEKPCTKFRLRYDDHIN